MRKNIGHRLGGQNKENENTIHALYSTLNLIGSKNFRYWETDVRESKDGILYCFHDDFIEGKNIDELTWDEICISGQNLGIEIPLFEEVTNILKNRYEKFMIEIKFIHSDEARGILLSRVSSNDNWILMSTPSRFLRSFPKGKIYAWMEKFHSENEKIVRVGRHSINLFKAYNNRISWSFTRFNWFFGF